MIAGSQVAGFWSRVGASVVDAVFLLVVAVLGAFLIGVIGGSLSGVRVLLIYAIPVVYYIWGWSSWSGGQTLGKRALNQRLVNANGQPLTKMRAFGRILGTIISALPLGLGYLWAAWDSHKQTWHDKMVGSYVLLIAGAAHVQTAGILAEPSRMPCPRCGESIPLNARVCRFCGAEFESGGDTPGSGQVE